MLATEIDKEAGVVRHYSTNGKYIHGGNPEGDYVMAEDSIDADVSYVETDKDIPNFAGTNTKDKMDEIQEKIDKLAALLIQ